MKLGNLTGDSQFKHLQCVTFDSFTYICLVENHQKPVVNNSGNPPLRWAWHPRVAVIYAAFHYFVKTGDFSQAHFQQTKQPRTSACAPFECFDLLHPVIAPYAVTGAHTGVGIWYSWQGCQGMGLLGDAVCLIGGSVLLPKPSRCQSKSRKTNASGVYHFMNAASESVRLQPDFLRNTLI